jgi:hypothetical protein
VVVAVALVLMVEMPTDDVVRMVAVGDRFVTAARPVLMRTIVGRARMTVCASVGIRARDGDLVVVLLCPHRHSSWSPNRSITRPRQ